MFEITGLLDTGIDTISSDEVAEYTWQGKLFTDAFTVMFNMPDIIAVCTYLLLVLIFAEVYQESRLHLFDPLDFRRRWLYGYIALVMVFFGSQIILFVLLFAVDDDSGGLQLSVYLFVTACNIVVVIIFVVFSIYLSVTFSGSPFKGQIQKERLHKVASVVNWWTAGRVLWGLTTLTSSSEPWLAMLPAWAAPMVITGALVMSEVLPFSWVLYGNFFNVLAMDASQAYADESMTLLWQQQPDESDGLYHRPHSESGSISAPNSHIAGSSSSLTRHSSLQVESHGQGAAHDGVGSTEPRPSAALHVSKEPVPPITIMFQNDFDLKSVRQIVMESTNTIPSPVVQRFRVLSSKAPFRERELLMKKIAIPPAASSAVKKEFVHRLLDIHTRLRKEARSTPETALFTSVHGFLLQARGIVVIEDLRNEVSTLHHYITQKNSTTSSSTDLASLDGDVTVGTQHGGGLGRWSLSQCVTAARRIMAGVCKLHEQKMYHGYLSVFSVTVDTETDRVQLSDAGLAAVLHFAHHQLAYKKVRVFVPVDGVVVQLLSHTIWDS